MAAARKTTTKPVREARNGPIAKVRPGAVKLAVETKHGEARRAIVKGLRAFNDGFLGANRKRKPLSITLRAKGEIVGGLTGESYHNWLFVQLLWIDGRYRGAGFGEKLIAMAETEARSRGATGIVLDTVSFQAPDFYRKLGFVEFGRLTDHPKTGYVHHWMTKSL